MPFNINEIAIRMQVCGTDGQSQSDRNRKDPGGPAFDKEALIQECIRRTVEAIRISKER
jgi:hypothetical protein